MIKRFFRSRAWQINARRRVCALSLCVLVPLAGLHAQQASTPASRKLNAQTARQTKLQLPKATVAGLPVIAVVHRLSGWQLRALLPHSAAPFATTFDDSFIRTNIVAGYVLPDGRSVVARLPRDEAEMLDFAAQFRAGWPQASTESPALTLVRNDGSELKARFVGLDASTGLSLLEAEQPLAPPAQEGAPASPPAIGQHVRVIAPLPTVAADTIPATPAATMATAATQAATVAPPDTAPSGETGVIYMSMSEAAGQLTQIKRSPTGKSVEFTVEVEQVSPNWGGGVAFAETGEFFGIVNESEARATRLVSAESVRAAAARVLARRASVPQPWLGARGDAVALTPLNLFVARGWPELEARAMVNRHQGVLLTDVAPGTPAAVAGLRSGDIVARISQHEVHSVEDMSLLLQELGSNSVARFTVLRAAGPPLDLSVRLSEAQNPALETAQAEARAAEAEIKLAESESRLAAAETRLAEIETRTAEVEVRTCEAELQVAATDALKAAAQKRLREAQERMPALQTRMAQAQERAKAAQLHTADAQLRLHAAQVRMKRASDEHFGMPVMWLLPYGVRAISLWPPGAAPVSGRAGLLVVSIKPESRAAQAGLRLGDIIETINGRRANELGDLSEESPAGADFVNLLGIQRDGQSLTLKLTRPPEK